MTAVASPPSFQPLPRLQWNSGNNGQGGLNTMSADEVTRMFMPRKSAQRQNSSSSVTSSSSSSTAVPPSPQTNGGETPTTNGEQGGWGPRKKPVRGLWPSSSKAEPVSGISTARPQSLPATTSGQSAASTISAMHQQSSVLPSQNRLQIQTQQNGGRPEIPSSQAEPPAVLILLPLTSTFERKHITVPFFPEVLRIGRQTNAKTVPTPLNGYFDSKVLSRQHAEVWADRNGKIWIRDVKSSNGTFVNGARLSPENRDSDPHELREHDTLELGIDIVSEDQKSIVHHKVSAKVEHAGIFGNGTNGLDLNFGDIEANSGNGLIGPPTGQQMSQIRGRSGSQGSMGINGRMSGPPSMAGSNNGVLGPQRQMNYWLNPITIEQVVKKLTTELKQAKQQSQDLHRTGDFFSTLLTLEPGEQPPKRRPEEIKDSHVNGVLPQGQFEVLSPFSQPPAPPPQQPLPEKPDSARSFPTDLLCQPFLKRTESERSKSATNSPIKPDPPSSQILSLVEELTSAKREIDSQGDRVRQLETMLKQERRARESAEERARNLLEGNFPRSSNHDGIVEEEAFEPPSEIPTQQAQHRLPNGYGSDSNEVLTLNGTSNHQDPQTVTKNVEGLHRDTQSVDASTSRLQDRLELMVREMDEMKLVMESYRRRAESAEEESKGLAEMVERIRSQTNTGALTASVTHAAGHSANNTTTTNLPSTITPGSNHNPLPNPTDSMTINRPATKDITAFTKALESVMAGDGGGGDGVGRAAPWASMVGVVLIGVGIMAYLNGWQGGER